ncbi:hypothetical protein FACS1894109_20540 [Spirochaetia bacterium]|nr:hypothetical protein FACS1894109_20540 [Spirochaetia bacterium]
MENTIFINSLKNHFFIPFAMLEKIIEICPDELWNEKKSGFIFWHQLLHTFVGMYFWLQEENDHFDGKIMGKNVITELDDNPEKVIKTIYSKQDIIEFCNESKNIAEKWFDGKDDKWLNSPSAKYKKMTNFDVMMGQIKHMMYHIGHCEAIFRENKIKTGEYLDYYG